MSDLGHQNDAQSGLIPPYNTMMDYMRSLAQAVRKPYAPYAELGLKRGDDWWQINTNVLQIENEYYATIRPKRVIRTGERPLEALCSRGIQYIEVRCMDVDPFEPIGISLQTARFLDVYLLHCALNESRPIDLAQGEINANNFAKVVKEGRRPGLLLNGDGCDKSLPDWGSELLLAMLPVAQLLDSQCGGQSHSQALEAQRAKLSDVSLTPSAKVLQQVIANGSSYAAFGLQQSKTHTADFAARPLTQAQRQAFQVLSTESIAAQAAIESEQTGDFDAFIEDYRSRTPSELCNG
jgi:glutamate--cysteine ligase